MKENMIQVKSNVFVLEIIKIHKYLYEEKAGKLLIDLEERLRIIGSIQNSITRKISNS